MSLIFCPECSHEVSVNAVSCPNCGLPIAHQPTPEVVYVAEPKGDGFPPWPFVPIGVAALALVFLAIFLIRSGDNGNTNLNINTVARRDSTIPERDTRTSTVPATSTSGVSVPPSQTTSVPSTSTSAPVAPPADKGSVTIKAVVQPARGGSQPARNVKFYLLDKDVEAILSEARIDPIEGNTLEGSLGLAAVFPDRYGDFQRRAMRAIGNHVKSSGTTGTGGNAEIKSVNPDGYYLFAISRVGSGFALWNQSVSVIAGDNMLNLSPQPVTEVQDTEG